MYDDSISHLSENFIRRILEVQEAFLKHPDDVAMMVYNLSDTLLYWYIGCVALP